MQRSTGNELVSMKRKEMMEMRRVKRRAREDNKEDKDERWRKTMHI